MKNDQGPMKKLLAWLRRLVCEHRRTNRWWLDNETVVECKDCGAVWVES